MGFQETLKQPWITSLQATLSQPHYRQRFEHTVVIPILDLYGQYVSAMFRQLGNKEPKFDAISFSKNNHVFGLCKTYPNILFKNEMYVVEGVFDFLVLWQTGIKHAVAANGCNLSTTQISLCGRFTQRFNLVFDPDHAGRTGAIKTKNALEKWGYTCKSINLDEQCDLDDYILKYGVQRFLQL